MLTSKLKTMIVRLLFKGSEDTFWKKKIKASVYVLYASIIFRGSKLLQVSLMSWPGQKALRIGENLQALNQKNTRKRDLAVNKESIIKCSNVKRVVFMKICVPFFGTFDSFDLLFELLEFDVAYYIF